MFCMKQNKIQYIGVYRTSKNVLFEETLRLCIYFHGVLFRCVFTTGHGVKRIFYWESLDKALKTLSQWPDVNVLVEWCPCLRLFPHDALVLQLGPWGSRSGHHTPTPTPTETHTHAHLPPSTLLVLYS